MDLTNNINISQIRELLSDYLKKNNLRKTPERFAILDEIYSRTGHFDIESIHKSMREKNYRVSLATLYNNMDILINAGLVLRHQFGKKINIYEKMYARSQHDHLICSNCGKITEFCDPRIIEIENCISKNTNFEIHNHSLYFFGLCSDCKNIDNK